MPTCMNVSCREEKMRKHQDKGLVCTQDLLGAQCGLFAAQHAQPAGSHRVGANQCHALLSTSRDPTSNIPGHFHVDPYSPWGHLLDVDFCHMTDLDPSLPGTVGQCHHVPIWCWHLQHSPCHSLPGGWHR